MVWQAEEVLSSPRSGGTDDGGAAAAIELMARSCSSSRAYWPLTIQRGVTVPSGDLLEAIHFFAEPSSGWKDLGPAGYARGTDGLER
jgi:hypothetical protein